MNLKNAVAVCLISLFSATLVVLIARSLDLQAAARIEPQLASIVEELQAIRKLGGIPASSPAAGTSEAVADGLIVYYFHGNTRCSTCQAIESQSHGTVQAEFAAQVSRGEIAWKVLNYEQPAVSALARKFEVQIPVIVLARMKGGQLQEWRRLDKVWALVGNRTGFAAYVGGEIRGMLGGENSAPRRASVPDAKPASSAAAAPVLPASAPLNLPVPPPPADLPVPK